MNKRLSKMRKMGIEDDKRAGNLKIKLIKGLTEQDKNKNLHRRYERHEKSCSRK